MYNQQPMYQSVPIQRNQLGNGVNVMEAIGEGKISVQPDLAIITLGVVTDGVVLTDVLRNNSEAIAAVTTALQNMGIPKDNIKTVDYRIDIQYDYIDGKQEFRGYRVTHNLEVTITDTEMVGEVVDTAVTNGANSISNIKFSVKDPSGYYRQVLSLAIKDAQEKAKTMAQTLGVTLNPTPYRIIETGVLQPPPPIPYETGMLVKGVSTTIELGTMDIKATIQAKFSYYS